MNSVRGILCDKGDRSRGNARLSLAVVLTRLATLPP